jgi:hypothetical protein
MKDNDIDNAKPTVKIDHVALDIKEVTEVTEVGDVTLDKKEKQSSDSFDNSLLHQAVADGGRWAYGVMFVEVWVLNDDKTQLFRPEGGWWIDPVFHSSCGDNCKVCRLTNPERVDFLKPEPLCPGEGLAGFLWSAASVETVEFREIKSIAEDPDQPWNPRLQLLGEIGLGLAAGVPFNCHGGQKGIVVYMAREYVNMNRLRSSSNELYLKAASSLMGAAYALRQPRLQMQNDREAQLAAVMRRVRHKIIALRRFGVKLNNLAQENQEKKTEKFTSMRDLKKFEQIKKGIKFVGKKITATVIKSKGAGNQPPPASDWEQSAWTFAGSFITLLMVCRLNVYLFDVHGPDFTIVLGYVRRIWILFCFCPFNQHDLISVPVSVSTRQSIWSSCYSLVWLDSRPCLTATQCYRWSGDFNDDCAPSIVCGQHEYLDASGTGNVASCHSHGQDGCYAPARRSRSSSLCHRKIWMGQYAVCFGGERYCNRGGYDHQQFL